jgi:hypothetical protein
MGDFFMRAAMGETVSAKATALVPLGTLSGLVKASIAAGDKALDKAEQHYKSAGLYLIEARERLPIEEPGKRFTAYIVGECRMKPSRAYELIAIAEGRLTLEEIRAKKNESSKAAHAKTRAAAKSGFPLNSGKPQQQQAKRFAHSEPTENDCDDCNNDSERWERSLGNVAGDAISLCSFWTREFGEEWENFEVPSTAVTLAKQAAKAWAELAANLTKRRKASLN